MGSRAAWSAVARTVHCSLNLPQPSRLLLMNNGTLDRPRAFEGLRPAFSAHVRWCEHGAPVECAVTRAVHCSLNLPQASRLLLMNNRTLDRPKAFEGLRPPFSAHVSWCEHGAPVECAVARTVHCSLNLPQPSRLLGMTKGRAALTSRAVAGLERFPEKSVILRGRHLQKSWVIRVAVFVAAIEGGAVISIEWLAMRYALH